MRSSETCSKPASRALGRGRDGAARCVHAVQSTEHVRRRRLHPERATRVKPPRRSARSSSGSVDSGLASVVTSAPAQHEAEGICASAIEQAQQLARRPAASACHRRRTRSLTRRSPVSARACAISSSAASTYSEGCPGPFGTYVLKSQCLAATSGAKRHVDVDAERHFTVLNGADGLCHDPNDGWCSRTVRAGERRVQINRAVAPAVSRGAGGMWNPPPERGSRGHADAAAER